jgi:hypothetical protein
MHDVFSNQYRRAILYQLQQSDEPMAVTTVSNQVLARKRGADGGSREDRPDEPSLPESVRAHIEKMEEFGILGWDRRTDTVWIPDSVTISVASPWDDADSGRSRDAVE